MPNSFAERLNRIAIERGQPDIRDQIRAAINVLRVCSAAWDERRNAEYAAEIDGAVCYLEETLRAIGDVGGAVPRRHRRCFFCGGFRPHRKGPHD